MTFDPGRWLSEFPVREHALYLDHAAVCPLPRPVAEAMRRRITEQEEAGHENYREWQNNHLSCRHLGSRLIGCSPDDISIVRSQSLLCLQTTDPSIEQQPHIARLDVDAVPVAAGLKRDDPHGQGPMQNKCFSPRKNIWPLLMAGEP